MMCPVYNLPMLFGSKYSDDFKASIDRKDSSKGYIKGNVIWVSNRANKYKNAMKDQKIISYYIFI